MFQRLLLLLLLALPLFAQKKVLTYDVLADPKDRILFSGAIQSDFRWLDDSRFVWPRSDARGDFVGWRLFDVTTGRESALFDRTALEKALGAAGLSADEAKTAAASEELVIDGKAKALVLTVNDDLYIYELGGAVTRLTSTAGSEEEATFSPDARHVAFVRNNDLYVVDRAGKETRITTDGSSQILNGKLDYVYQEEVYGRDIWKGFWWSPDSRKIAFLQLDERQVPEFTVIDHIPYRIGVNTFHYPKAGDPNPGVKLFIASPGGGKPIEVDNSRYSTVEPLIVNVGWSDDGKLLTWQVQNREQTWLDLNVTAGDGSGSRTILRDTTRAWVDPLGNPVWLPDGTFLWQSERTGYRHVYHYRTDGTLLRQMTSGNWEVRNLHGADRQFVYFSGTERSVLGQDVYRIRHDGSGLQRLSGERGTHAAVFNPSLTHYVDKWSNISTPPQIRVHRGDGTLRRTVEENRVSALAEFDLPKPEFLQVKARDGFVMEAVMIKPRDFDPSKKYPVYQFVYGGPHAQQVRDYWDTNATRGLFHRLVAEQGVIVWIVDNRTASGKGAVSAWPVYKNFGESELRDLEDGLTWLRAQPYIDPSRAVIYGWSYGGFMVLYAMTHSRLYSAGISGAPVTDWRDYDSIYTERLMMLPKNNPDGYRNSSPRFDAKNLHGNLLLIHGTTDDNVHLQNTIQMAWELQQLGKPFEMMLLPRARHTVTDRKTIAFLQKTILEFVKRELGK